MCTLESASLLRIIKIVGNIIIFMNFQLYVKINIDVVYNVVGH